MSRIDSQYNSNRISNNYIKLKYLVIILIALSCYCCSWVVIDFLSHGLFTDVSQKVPVKPSMEEILPKDTRM